MQALTLYLLPRVTAAREHGRQILLVTSDQALASRIRLQLQRQPQTQAKVLQSLYFRVLLESQSFLAPNEPESASSGPAPSPPPPAQHAGEQVQQGEDGVHVSEHDAEQGCRRSRRLSFSAESLEKALVGRSRGADSGRAIPSSGAVQLPHDHTLLLPEKESLLARFTSWADGGYEGLRASAPTRRGLVLYTVQDT